jgi:Ran GTPase-activating protein (RanGAP) involved in mRNA processing and transport
MGIIHGGDAEYEENQPTFEEKVAKMEGKIIQALDKEPGVLKLSGQYLAIDDVKALCANEKIRNVRLLDLSDNQINDEAFQLLFEADNLSDLEELVMSINYITEEGLIKISASTSVAIKNLKSLVISDNKLTDASVQAMVQSPYFSKLEKLDFSWNEIGNGATIAFGETVQLPNLKTLLLERGYVDAEGMEGLLKGGVAKQLEELDLSSNKLDDKAIIVLAQSPSLSQLKVLRLSYNQFGDEGAKALGESTTLIGLTHLYVGRNYFGEEGGKAIYETKTLKNLKTLMIQEGVETTPDLVNYSRPELLRPGHYFD